ncbi:MAG TPA: site-specific integrase [Candidatus Angelobacter sp.]|nr:site-specific integrase [Candidatus Angelobacter sp.]
MARRRYQKGSIRKRGTRNPVWELQFWADEIQPNGSLGRKRESVILGFVADMNKRQAMKIADEHLRPLNLGKLTPFATILFREFIEKHFIPNAFPTLKTSTRKRYQYTIKNHLLPAFGDLRLCDLQRVEIQAFVLRKMEKGLSWETADLLRNLLSKIFRCAKKWGFFAGDNPASEIDLPHKKPVREKCVLMPQQIPKLLAELREPYRTMALVGILTGLRVGEILGLRWSDVDFDTAQLRVSQRYYRGEMDSPKTRASQRTLPLPPECIQALRRLQAVSRPEQKDALVFRTKKGTPYSDTNILHRQLKPAGQKIGAPWLSWHTFRRTHATLLQLAGGSLKDAQAQLGHTRLSTTLEIYTIPIPAHQREAVAKLSQLVTSSDEFRENAKELPMPTQQIQ